MHEALVLNVEKRKQLDAQYENVSRLLADIGKSVHLPMAHGYEVQGKVAARHVFTVAPHPASPQRHILVNIATGEENTAPDGVYLFVVKSDYPGTILTMKHFSLAKGHTSLHQKNGVAGTVRFAGTLHYRKGKLIMWTNNSGHYKPAASLAHTNLIPWLRRLLPIDKFEALPL